MKKIFLALSFCFLFSCGQNEQTEVVEYSATAVQTGITTEQQQALDGYLLDLEQALKAEGYSDEIIAQAIEEARAAELKEMK